MAELWLDARSLSENAMRFAAIAKSSRILAFIREPVYRSLVAAFGAAQRKRLRRKFFEAV